MNWNCISLIISSLIIIFSLLLLYIILPYYIKIVLWNHNFLKIKDNNKIYLTFDDGPDPTYTKIILEHLNKYKIKATFFIRGCQAVLYPELVQAIKNEGHAIGQHGYKHLNGWKTGPLMTFNDFRRADNLFKKLSIQTTLYRPPYGKINLIHVIYILLKNKKIILWDVDPKDYESSPEYVAETIKASSSHGKVLLLHDSRSNIYNNNPENTVKALQLLDDYLSEKVMQFDILK